MDFLYDCICVSVVSGNIDATTYEDTCREMFGVHAFVVFTIDRLMQNIVRQVSEGSVAYCMLHRTERGDAGWRSASSCHSSRHSSPPFFEYNSGQLSCTECEVAVFVRTCVAVL